MPVQITLLGVPSVMRDGERVVLDTRKALALIAHLALAERPRSRDALCDLLWPGHDAAHARGALRRTLSTLRGAVGEQHVDASGDGVALRRGPGLEVDVDEFRSLAADGRARRNCRPRPRASRAASSRASRCATASSSTTGRARRPTSCSASWARCCAGSSRRWRRAAPTSRRWRTRAAGWSSTRCTSPRTAS